MRVILSILLTAFCWGCYGPVLSLGHSDMHSSLRAFICVGLAYFLIAVLVPGAMLSAKGESGGWTFGGTIWSLAAGAAGALGALGVILALHSGGKPVYVMPLVFGGAPVVNSFLTIYMSKTYKQVGPVFIAGLIVVITGAAVVLIFRPGVGGADFEKLSFESLMKVIASIALVVVSWGAYGPVLHKGQMKMGGSRLRPLICVGLAYFAIAVVLPLLLMGALGDEGHWTFRGALWSLAAGSAGAVGALGIILAFTYGGKPVYVMPLVFGGAPVISTFVSMAMRGGTPSAPFYAGLMLVVAGAVVVLVFAPKGHPAPAAAREPALAK
jgi:hypothetical protein